MRSAVYTGQFKRDVKRLEKRGKEMEKLRAVIRLLLADAPLPRALADHRGCMNGEDGEFLVAGGAEEFCRAGSRNRHVPPP